MAFLIMQDKANTASNCAAQQACRDSVFPNKHRKPQYFSLLWLNEWSQIEIPLSLRHFNPSYWCELLLLVLLSIGGVKKAHDDNNYHNFQNQHYVLLIRVQKTFSFSEKFVFAELTEEKARSCKSPCIQRSRPLLVFLWGLVVWQSPQEEGQDTHRKTKIQHLNPYFTGLMVVIHKKGAIHMSAVNWETS